MSKYTTFSRMSSTSIEDIGRLTGNFDEKNLVAEFQFGKIYLGEYEDILGTKTRKTVKIWDDKSEANRGRFLDELYLLQHEQCSKHPGFMKLKKFACREDDDKLGAVYAVAPLDTLYNLVEKDSFTWLHRIKSAIGIASVLRFLHADDPPYEPYLVRNLDAAHILIDEAHNAKLLDFGRISGGIFPNAPYPINSSSRKYGYVDPFNHGDEWSKKSDVFAFGIILLMLLTKRVDKDDRVPGDAPPSIYKSVCNQFGSKNSAVSFYESNFSLVHKSLEAQPSYYSSDGYKISNLAIQCVLEGPEKRPSMDEVMENLLQLSIVKQSPETLGLDDLLCDVYYTEPIYATNIG